MEVSLHRILSINRDTNIYIKEEMWEHTAHAAEVFSKAL